MPPMCTCFEKDFKAQKVKKQMLMFVLNTYNECVGECMYVCVCVGYGGWG